MTRWGSRLRIRFSVSCTDGSREIASRFTDCILEGAWEREGPRRQAVVAACRGYWVLDVDADERVSPELAAERGIEHGEYAIDAIRREMREEIGAELDNIVLLGTLENIFTFAGTAGHEWHPEERDLRAVAESWNAPPAADDRVEIVSRIAGADAFTPDLASDAVTQGSELAIVIDERFSGAEHDRRPACTRASRSEALRPGTSAARMTRRSPAPKTTSWPSCTGRWSGPAVPRPVST